MEQSLTETEPSYILKEEYVEADSDDDFAYEEVIINDDEISSGEEDLSATIRNDGQLLPPPSKSAGHLISKDISTSPPRPEVVEDFVCNFLASNKMNATLHTFQTEWYRLIRNNQLPNHRSQVLPDAYAQIRQLENSLLQVEIELQNEKKKDKQIKETLLRLQKERDYHRMHHRRVLHEKERLLGDLKRLKNHYSEYEPLMQSLKQKYQIITKEKMLANLERDRVKSEVACLQSTLQSVQQATDPIAPSHSSLTHPITKSVMKPKKVLDVPPLPAVNMYHDVTKLPACTHFTRTGGFQPSHSIPAHSYAVTALDTHPSKPVVATASDDHSWKLWTISSGELLMNGDGHSDWLSSIQFNPEGSYLSTGSGDGTVKVWDLKNATCIQTLSDHQQPVWGVAWHWAGSILASAAMDNIVKLWHPFKGQCVSTLRGHSDSVNGVAFLPFSNTLVTCSADKSVSLWDTRTGLCVHTFYGHLHACCSVKPTYQGWEIFSGDCFGNLICWDVRGHSCSGSWYFGLHAINSITVDKANTLVACAGDNCNITLLDPSSNKEWSLEGHMERVLAVGLTSEADGLISSAHDGILTVWQ